MSRTERFSPGWIGPVNLDYDLAAAKQHGRQTKPVATDALDCPRTGRGVYATRRKSSRIQPRTPSGDSDLRNTPGSEPTLPSLFS